MTQFASLAIRKDLNTVTVKPRRAEAREERRARPKRRIPIAYRSRAIGLMRARSHESRPELIMHD